MTACHLFFFDPSLVRPEPQRSRLQNKGENLFSKNHDSLSFETSNIVTVGSNVGPAPMEKFCPCKSGIAYFFKETRVTLPYRS
jgi:hypothetical protein